MIYKDAELIRDITKELKLNSGRGYSVNYINRVLSTEDKRKNKEIELIASFLNSAVVESKALLTNKFTKLESGKKHWVPVKPELIKSE